MISTEDVATTFEDFANFLKEERPDAISSIAKLNNGFEGWVKLEFYFWLIRKGLKPTLADGLDEDIGLEYKVALDQRSSGMDIESKQCDIWIRDSTYPLSDPHYHYIELKAPFSNHNKAKMLKSAANDLWYVSRIRRSHEKASTGSAIVLGVGFNEKTWEDAWESIKRNAYLPENMERKYGTLDDGNKIWWLVATKNYK